MKTMRSQGSCCVSGIWDPCGQEVAFMRRRMGVFSILVLFVCFLPPVSARAAIPLPAIPDWENTDAGRYGTGLGVADLNRDGWMDFVVANGNDMARQPVTVWL